MYNDVRMEDVPIQGRNVLDSFLLAEVDEAGYDLRLWHLPIQAVATRTELFGLEGNEQSLEFLGRSVVEPQIEGEITGEVHPHYSEYLNAEYQVLAQGARLSTAGRTLMGLDSGVSTDLNSSLDEVRTKGLGKLGVGSARVMARTSGTGVLRAASAAMDCTDEVSQRILQACEREQRQIDAWRLDMVFQTCPMIQRLMESDR